MIQRIQTFYLVLALSLIALSSFLPLAEVAHADIIYTFSALGLTNAQSGEVIYSGLPLISLAILILVINLFIIFNYKKRVRQMRVATFNIILMLGFIGVSFLFITMAVEPLDQAITAYKITMIFPLIAAVFNYLAIRSIGKDEALIRSIDRIR